MTLQAVRPKQNSKTAAATVTEQGQASITEQESFQVTSTLLEAGLGCITYLRGIFPDDCFTDEKLKIAGTESSTRIRKLKEGASDDSDRLIAYINQGVKDALEKKYLKTLVSQFKHSPSSGQPQATYKFFAIYLDPAKPHDLVECYTFNFSYTTKPTKDSGGKGYETISTMHLRDEFRNVDINDQKQESLVTKKRKTKSTLAEAKNSVQKLIRQIISSTVSLGDLPNKRFVTLKLYYTDDTPDDYDPPFFRPADYESNKYVFGTECPSQTPERTALGRLDTGFHGVAINLVSIASHLPSTDEAVPRPENETVAEQIQANREEAKERNIIWDAEAALTQDSSLEMEADTVEGISVCGSARKAKPFGQRMHDDSVLPCDFSPSADGLYSFSPEATLVAENESCSQSNVPSASVKNPPLCAMDSETLGDFSVDSAQLLAKMKNHLISNGFEPGTLRDYDSNLAVAKKLQMTVPTAESLHSDDDPISSFGTQSPATDRQHDISKANVSCDDSGVDVHCASNAPQTTRPCDCGDARDHGSQVCCDLCQNWFHTSCYGYDFHDRSLEDAAFTCYQCRLFPASCTLSQKQETVLNSAMGDLQNLAVFRRALDEIYLAAELPTSIALASFLDCDTQTAYGILSRLKGEQYIISQHKEPESLLENYSASQRRRKTSFKPMIARSKHVLVVNNSSEQIELKKRHYFTPGKGAEETITRSISNASSILKYGCSTPDKAHSVGALQQIVKPATNENDVSPSSLSMKPAEEVMREVYFPDDQFEAARLQNASRNRRVQRESGIVAKSDHALPGLALGTNSPRSNAQSSWPIELCTPERPTNSSLGKRRSQADSVPPGACQSFLPSRPKRTKIKASIAEGIETDFDPVFE